MNFLNEKAETKRFSDMKSYIEFLMTDMIKFDDYGLFIWSALHHKPCQLFPALMPHLLSGMSR